MGRKGGGGYRIEPKSNMIYVFGVRDRKRVTRSTGHYADDKQYLKYVEVAHQEILDEIIDSKKPKPLSVDLPSFAHQVLELTKNKRNNETQKDYIQKTDKYIIPYFKRFELKDLKPLDIEHWQQALLDQGLSTTTVKRVRNIFSIILKKAVANEMINRNPCDFAETIKVQHKKQEPYSVEEMNILLDKSKGWFKVYLHLAFTTGLRVGEMLGLKWEDIDFEKKVIFLERTYRRGIFNESSDTKNHNRIIIIPDFVIEMMKEYHKVQGADFVFVNQYKKPFYEAKNIVKYHLKPLIEKINKEKELVKYKSLKATRHTYISIMRNEGVAIDLVLDQVGHSKEVSDKHYFTSVVTDKKIQAVNNVFAEFKSKKA